MSTVQLATKSSINSDVFEVAIGGESADEQLAYDGQRQEKGTAEKKRTGYHRLSTKKIHHGVRIDRDRIAHLSIGNISSIAWANDLPSSPDRMPRNFMTRASAARAFSSSAMVTIS